MMDEETYLVWVVYNDGRGGTKICKGAPALYLGRWKDLPGRDPTFVNLTTNPHRAEIEAVANLVGLDYDAADYEDMPSDVSIEFEVSKSWWVGKENDNPVDWEE